MMICKKRLIERLLALASPLWWQSSSEGNASTSVEMTMSQHIPPKYSGRFCTYTAPNEEIIGIAAYTYANAVRAASALIELIRGRIACRCSRAMVWRYATFIQAIQNLH